MILCDGIITHQAVSRLTTENLQCAMFHYSFTALLCSTSKVKLTLKAYS